MHVLGCGPRLKVLLVNLNEVENRICLDLLRHLVLVTASDLLDDRRDLLDRGNVVH
jgi:hypothetical protein